ncbi:MFS transporter [Okibacterium endophyticum]
MSTSTTPPIDARAAEDEPVERVSNWFIFTYWFAQFANWMALLTPVVVTIALKVATIATPEEKAAQLGIVLAIGALSSVIATPIWGALSDRTTARLGRRKTWMLIGVIGGGIGLTVVALSPNLFVLGVGWFICQIAFNANQAALNALLPDQVPDHQRGRVSGLLGLSSRVATLAGTFVTVYTTGSDLLMFLVPWAVSAASIGLLFASFTDSPADPAALRPYSWKEFGRTFWISPRKHPDFAWAFASRFLLFIGISFLTTYQVYFLTDHLGVATDDVAGLMTISGLIMAAMTVLVSIAGGWLSDRTGRRKPFVLAAAIVAGVGLLVLGTASDLPQFFIGAAIESAGAGLYLAVDLALVAAVLPNKADTAKDMGVFQIANSLPQSIAPAIAPIFLMIGSGGTADNYVAVFTAAAIFAVIGAVLILPIRGTR